MSNTGIERTEEELLNAFSDNTKGNITAQFLRDFVVSIYNRVDEVELQQGYTPASHGNWNESPPTSVQEALDRIAAAIGPIP